MTSVNFPIIFPLNVQELFSFAIGFLFACIVFMFFVHDVKPKQTIQGFGIVALILVVIIVLFASVWRPT